MTEEENKAIEYLKDYIKSDLNYFTIEFNDNLRIAINLIESYKKENEELKNGKVYQDFKYYKELAGQYQGSCVSKDKIREKREQEEKLLESGEPRGAYGVIKYREGKIKAYEELLEEGEQNE